MNELNESDQELITKFLKNIIFGLFDPYSYLGHQEPIKSIFKQKIMDESTKLGQLHNLLGNIFKDELYQSDLDTPELDKRTEIIPKVIPLNKLDLVVAKFREIQKCKDIPTKEIIEIFLKSKNYKLSDFFNENIADLVYSIHIDNISCNYNIYQYDINISFGDDIYDYLNNTFGMLMFYWSRHYISINSVENLFNIMSVLIKNYKLYNPNTNGPSFNNLFEDIIDSISSYLNLLNIDSFLEKKIKFNKSKMHLKHLKHLKYYFMEKWKLKASILWYIVIHIILIKHDSILSHNFILQISDLFNNFNMFKDDVNIFLETFNNIFANINYLLFNKLFTFEQENTRYTLVLIFNNKKRNLETDTIDYIIKNYLKKWLRVTNYMGPNALYDQIKTGKADDLLVNAINNNLFCDTISNMLRELNPDLKFKKKEDKKEDKKII